MKTGTLFITDDPNVTLTCYIHDESNEMQNTKIRPAVLVFPGGGYQACSDREAEPVALAYMAEGYNAFVLRYTVGVKSKFPKPLNDAEKALTTIRERADEWHVDKDKIAVIGFSAGGHLAAALGTMGSVKPSALILCYPCILEKIGEILANPIPGVDDRVDKTTPPTFMFTTAADALVDAENTLAFATALNNAKIPYELHVFQNGTHGLSLAKPLTSSGFKINVEPAAAQWFPLSVDWLRGLWGDFDTTLEPVLTGVLTDFDVYGLDVAMKYLWENPECKKLLLESIPVLADEKTAQQTMGISLRIMSSYSKDIITDDLLAEIECKLKKIKKI